MNRLVSSGTVIGRGCAEYEVMDTSLCLGWHSATRPGQASRESTVGFKRLGFCRHGKSVISRLTDSVRWCVMEDSPILMQLRDGLWETIDGQEAGCLVIAWEEILAASWTGNKQQGAS